MRLEALQTRQNLVQFAVLPIMPSLVGLAAKVRPGARVALGVDDIGGRQAQAAEGAREAPLGFHVDDALSPQARQPSQALAVLFSSHLFLFLSFFN